MLKTSKADRYFMNTLGRIKESGTNTSDIGNTASKWDDGERADTRFITNVNFDYNLDAGEFPLTTFRRVYWKNAIKEIFWIYQDASNDLNLLRDKYKVYYWDKHTIGDDTIGQRYGALVKKYRIIEDEVIGRLKKDKTDRRAMIDLWQYADIQGTQGLPSCAFNCMFMVRGEFLDAMLTQRSNDMIPALSINQIQYVALQMMIAHTLGLKPGRFTHNIGNVHYYNRQTAIVDAILSTTIEPSNARLVFNPKSTNFYEYTIDDFSVEDYYPKDVKYDIEIANGSLT